MAKEGKRFILGEGPPKYDIFSRREEMKLIRKKKKKKIGKKKKSLHSQILALRISTYL